MDTPHPSYPPLDLARQRRGGGHQPKWIEDFAGAGYSENIVCAEPSVHGLKHGLRRAIAIADDEALRSANYARNGIVRSWPASFEQSLDHCAKLAR